MLIDILTFSLQLRELDKVLRNYKVEKIVPLSYQSYSIVLYHSDKPRQALLIELGESPHIRMTSQKFTKSKTRAFALSMEKRLLTTRIHAIKQRGFDYVAELIFTAGEGSQLSLIIELCPRKTNLILLKDKKILDLSTKVPATKNRYRTLLSGEIYREPPLPPMTMPNAITEEQWQEAKAKSKDLEANLGNPFFGQKREFPNLPPKTLVDLQQREAAQKSTICFGAGLMRNIWGISIFHLEWIADDYKKLEKLLKISDYSGFLYQHNDKHFISPLKLSEKSLIVTKTDINEAVNHYYCVIYPQTILEKARNRLKKCISSKQAKLKKRLRNIEMDIDNAQKAPLFQRYGELILSSLDVAKVHGDLVHLTDYYQEGSPMVEIKIDPAKPLLANAQKYFKKAKRAKRGYELMLERQEATEQELAHLKSELEKLENICDLPILEEKIGLYQVFAREKTQKERVDDKFKGILRIFVNENYEFWLGKSQNGNEKLLKMARGHDIWMHVQDYHGSHLIIRAKKRTQAVPLDILLQAAEMAAYHSKARKKEKVEVSYTKRKHVVKQKGKVGAVTYSQQKSLIVAPKPLSGGDK